MGSPIRHTDSLGLMVDVVYDKGTGMVTVTDRDTGKSATANAFSGDAEMNYSPAPNGEYYLSWFPWLKPCYYALVFKDDRIDDYITGSTSNYPGGGEMGNIRFHSGYASHGCLTVPGDCSNSPEWKAIEDLIKATTKGPGITIGGQKYPNYGDVTIKGEGYGSRP